MKEYYYWEYEFPIGKLLIEGDGEGITCIDVRCQKEHPSAICQETSLIKTAKQQLDEYFAGIRKEFDLPLSVEGTEFQKKVWKALQDIPYGETCSYQDIAIAVGNKNACRAVGMANNRNKIIIVIPCHRVIGKNGTLVGYGGGLDIKEKLLALEKQFV